MKFSWRALFANLLQPLTAAAGSVLLLILPVFAEQDPSELSEGMTRNEVLKLWGPPVEKLEYEAKREDLWVYKETEVRFREGKVKWAKYREGSPFAKQQEEDQMVADREWDRLPGDSNTIAVEDILSEIMDGVPDEKEKEEKDGKKSSVLLRERLKRE